MRPHAKDAKHATEQVQMFRFNAPDEAALCIQNRVASLRPLRSLREAFIR